MTASEIAETLLNGNIAQAREEILTVSWQRRDAPSTAYEAAVMALDVVSAYVALIWDEYAGGDEYGAWESAHGRVRRCLEGAS